MQLPHLFGIGFHHCLPHRHLAVTSDNDFAIFADGEDSGAVPDGGVAMGIFTHLADMGWRPEKRKGVQGLAHLALTQLPFPCQCVADNLVEIIMLGLPAKAAHNRTVV
jgi:hypothetical protein